MSRRGESEVQPQVKEAIVVGVRMDWKELEGCGCDQ